MRTFIGGLILAAAAAMAWGCSSDMSMEPAGETKPCLMQSAGRDVLRLTVPADTQVTAKDGSLDLISKDRYVEVWLAGQAQTVDEAVGRVSQIIKDEFTDFKAGSTTGLTIAGASAKRLTGAGHEADDNDPGDADVVVFKVGGHVFVACTHGEHLSAAAEQWMMVVVKSAQAP